jgi:UDP-glucose-4-epimerase GalE
MSGVLVTGGAGYIGSHAVKALLARGERVVVFDNFVAGHREAVTRATAIVDGDIHDTTAIRDVLVTHKLDAVMHFAAWLSVNESVGNPAGYYYNNVAGALSVLQGMIDGGVRHFVFSSTAAVFGNPEQTPITELHPTRPINAYGQTKLAIEQALPHYDHAYSLRSVALRYFNAAGADPEGDLGEDHAPEIHVIPRAIDAALGRGRFQIFGNDYPTTDGTCLRDYVHVTDLAAAHILALDSLRSGARSTVYNLGNGRPTSVKDVVDAVAHVTGTPVPWEAAPRREGDPAILFASSDRIKRDLGWRPQYEDVRVIVETAYRWRTSHPNGYATGARS